MSKVRHISEKSNTDRKIAIFLGLLFLSFYILTAQGSIQSLDGTIMYELTGNMVEKGSVAINNPAGVKGIDGRLYSKYGWGQSLAAVPLYLAGKYAARLFPLPFAESYATKFFVSMLNPLVTAMTCMLLYAFGIRLGYSRKVALLTAFVFGLGTMAWPYAQTFYSEPLTGLLLLGMFYFLMQDRSDVKELLLGGTLLGVAAATRIGSLTALFAVGAYVTLTSGELRESGKRLVVFLTPLLGALVLISLYNYYRFGSLFETGYGGETFSTPLAKGVYGLLFSPGRGIFWYNLPLILSLVGFSALYKIHREKSLAFLLFVLVSLLFYSQWGAWEGGWVWGPRFLLVIVPYLAVFLGAYVNQSKSAEPHGLISVASPLASSGGTLQSGGTATAEDGHPRTNMRGFLRRRVNVTAALAVLTLLSTALQFSAVFVSPERYYYQQYLRDPKNHMSKIEYDIAYSPIFGQWQSLAKVVKNIRTSGFLSELAREQKAGGISEGEKGKSYFLTHNLAFNSPNIWLFYLWYAGAPKWLVLSILMLLLATMGFTAQRILFCLRGLSWV